MTSLHRLDILSWAAVVTSYSFSGQTFRVVTWIQLGQKLITLNTVQKFLEQCTMKLYELERVPLKVAMRDTVYTGTEKCSGIR